MLILGAFVILDEELSGTSLIYFDFRRALLGGLNSVSYVPRQVIGVPVVFITRKIII